MQTVIPKRTQNLILFLGIIFLFCTVSLFATNTVFMVSNEIYHGVSIGDIAVGGLTLVEAEAKLLQAFSAQIVQPAITIEYEGATWKIMAQDIDLSINAAGLAQQAYETGRTGNIFYQLKERYLTVNQGSIIPMSINYNKDKLNRILAEIAASIDREPRNAAIQYEGATLHILSETVGLKVEVSATLTDIHNQLNSKLTSLVPLQVSQHFPVIRDSDLIEIDGLVASYTTQFDSKDVNRSQNILLAAKSIHGILVKSGQEFSFNTQVGSRLAQNGYKEAPVFIEGKLVPDFGGGVCQVSSTLYNAVLLADMEVIERTPHFRPPGYVPLGQDATVADNLLDFRFKNSGTSNIYIASEVFGNQLTIFVFGKRRIDSPEVRIFAADTKIIEPNTIIKQDPNLELGKQLIESEGQKGFFVTTYRVKSINGHEIKREFLASDEFKSVDHIIRVGTKIKAPTK